MKACNKFYSYKLSKIINISFLTGIFPNFRKLAKVIHFLKSEQPIILGENYGPISLLPIFSKVFEKVIYKRMYIFLVENKLIYNRQFGFRANHFTNHALISTTEYIKLYIDSGRIAGGIFIYLQKAVDTVNNQILCDKLSYYGFRRKIN